MGWLRRLVHHRAGLSRPRIYAYSPEHAGGAHPGAVKIDSIIACTLLLADGRTNNVSERVRVYRIICT